MGEGEGEKKKHQKVRFNSACNETHLLEREVSATSSSSDSSNGSTESTITDNDLTNSDNISLDLSSPHCSSAEPGYDPNRIPSSIFNSGPTNNDWSVASNDSLFSITMGNNSFSRDHGFLVYKSGELMKLDEVFNLPITLPPVAEAVAVERDSAVNGEDDDIKGPEPPPKDNNEKKKNNNNNNNNNIVEINYFPDGSPKDIKFEDHCKAAKMPGDDLRNSARVSTQSDGSAASNSSFAFPILISQDTKNASNKSERAGKKEHTVSRPQQQSPKQSEAQRRSSPPPPKTRTLTSWFCCFSCCSFRCSMSLK